MVPSHITDEQRPGGEGGFLVRTHGKAANRFALATALCLSLTGCSLLFEAAPVAESSIDGGQDDAGVTANCGPSLPDTLALFHVNGDNFTESVEDFLGGAPGEGVTVTFPKDGVAELSPSPLEKTSGPGECGAAVLLTNRSRPFVRLDYDVVENVHSVDFWFSTSGVTNTIGRGALLTKDGSGQSLGDMMLFVLRSPGEADEHHVVLRLQDTEADDYFLCSKAIALNEWHHVAVSFDEANGAVLLVNGIAVDDATADLSVAFPGATCGEPSAAQTATLLFNSRDWLWGASNATSSVADEVMMGAVDELRFRSAPFTPSQAQDVYDSQRP